MDDQLIFECYKRATILLEYSQGFIRTQILRLQKEAPDAEEPYLRYLITRFDQLKQGNSQPRFIQAAKNLRDVPDRIKQSPLQLEFYPFAALEAIISAFPEPGASKRHDQLNQSNINTPVYDDNGLIIWHGNDAGMCSDIKSHISSMTGERYSWCISIKDASSMFSRYRVEGSGASAYFVLDTTKSSEDPMHALVVHAFVNQDKYRITKADNRNEDILKWSGVESKYPRLAGLKSVFIAHPLMSNEVSMEHIKKLGADAFSNLDRTKKIAFIQLGRKLYDPQQYADLDPELQHMFIAHRSTGINISHPAKRVAVKNALNALFPFEKVDGGQFLRSVIKSGNAEELFNNHPITTNTRKNQTLKYWKLIVQRTLNAYANSK